MQKQLSRMPTQQMAEDEVRTGAQSPVTAVYNPDFVPHITVPLVNEAFTPTDDDVVQAEEATVDAAREEVVFPWAETEEDLFFLDPEILYEA